MDPVFIKLDIKKYWAVTKRGRRSWSSFQFPISSLKCFARDSVCSLGGKMFKGKPR